MYQFILACMEQYPVSSHFNSMENLQLQKYMSYYPMYHINNYYSDISYFSSLNCNHLNKIMLSYVIHSKSPPQKLYIIYKKNLYK